MNNIQPEIKITHKVLSLIQQYIANHPPERGGALLGTTDDKLTITDFIPDFKGITTGASYNASTELTIEVQNLEKNQNVEFKGIVHSHPTGFDRLSSPDEEAIKDTLRMNSHQDFFIAPIVTLHDSQYFSQHLLDHELKLDNGKISFYVCHFQGERLAIETKPVTIISETKLHPSNPSLQSNSQTSISPLCLDIEQKLESVTNYLNVKAKPSVFLTSVEGCNNLPASKITLNSGLELLFIFSSSYPVHPPILLVYTDRNTEEIGLNWSLSIDENNRLLNSIESIKYLIEDFEKKV